MLRTHVLRALAPTPNAGWPLAFVMFACVFFAWSAFFQLLFIQAWPETMPVLETDCLLVLGLIVAYGAWAVLVHRHMVHPATGAGFIIIALAVTLRSITTLRHAAFYIRSDAVGVYATDAESFATIALTIGLLAYGIGFGVLVGSCAFDLRVRRRSPWWVRAA